MVAPGQWHKEHIWKGKESTIHATFCLVLLSSKITYLLLLVTKQMDLCTWYYSSCSKVFFIIYFKIKKFVTIVQQCNNHQMHYGLNHHYQLKEENNLLLWNVSDESDTAIHLNIPLTRTVCLYQPFQKS